jgi:hypothetical protein
MKLLRIIAQTGTSTQVQCQRARSSSRYFRKVILFCNYFVIHKVKVLFLAIESEKYISCMQDLD